MINLVRSEAVVEQGHLVVLDSQKREMALGIAPVEAVLLERLMTVLECLNAAAPAIKEKSDGNEKETRPRFHADNPRVIRRLDEMQDPVTHSLFGQGMKPLCRREVAETIRPVLRSIRAGEKKYTHAVYPVLAQIGARHTGMVSGGAGGRS